MYRMIVAASGALNVASIASVFGEKEYKPLVYPLDKLNKPGFLVIPAIEYNTSRNGETIHFVVVGPGYDQRLQDGQDYDLAHNVGVSSARLQFGIRVRL